MDMVKVVANTISKEEIDAVAKVVEENKNDRDYLLDIIEQETANYDNSNAPLEEGTAEYVNDGVLMEVNDDKEFEFDHFDNIDSTIDKIIDDNIADNLAKNYNLSDQDVVKFASVITRLRAKEKFNVYAELPDELKTYIDNIVMEQKDLSMTNQVKARQAVAKMVLEELIADAELDSISIDLEKAMQELMPGPVELYSEFNKEYIENDLLGVAEKLKEEHPKKAQNLLDMRRGYIDAYTYDPLYKILENGKIVKNIRRADVLWSRTDAEYIRLAGVCKFKLHALDTIRKALIKLGFTDIQAKRIITLFVYTYTNGVVDFNSEDEYNDIYRNALANYFEINIINLSITNGGNSEFSAQIMENLKALCNHIDGIIEQKEAELSNKKKKKKG